MKSVMLEIHITQRKPRNSEARKPVKIAVNKQRSPAPVEMRDEGADFFGAGDIDADLQPAFLTALGLPFLAARPARAQGAHDILSDKPTFLGIGQDGAERAHDLLHHDARALDPEPVLELTDHRHAELGQLQVADQRHEVQAKALAVALNRGPFEPRRDATVEP